MKLSGMKLGTALAAFGMVFAAASLPSLAYEYCGGYGGGCGGYGGYGQPQRVEVLRRDSFLNREINSDRGFLNGNYRHLEHEDRSIRRQAQREAFYNGGYLTPGQTHQLNREENNLQHQVNYDHRWL